MVVLGTKLTQNAVIEGDSLQLMPILPDGLIDLILSDLPYGVTNNAWDRILPLDELWEHYWRILKPNGVIALTATQPFSSQLIMSQPKYFRHEWIWLKNRRSNFAITVREPMKEHEHVLIFSRGKWTYNKQMQERTGAGKNRVKYNYNDRISKSSNYSGFKGKEIVQRSELRVPSSWQKFNVDTSGLHPTIKPVDLFRYLIRTYTNPGEIVLDNAAGSGTTGVAASLEGRSFILMEKEKRYIDVIRQRI